MTYENAIAWAVDNIPMSMYESYEDWAEDVESELQTPELFESQRFIGMLQDAWVRSGRSLEQEDNEDTSYNDSGYNPPAQEPIAEKPKVPEPTKPTYPEERVRQIPTTGTAPVVTTKRYDFTTAAQPTKKPSFASRISGGFRKLFKRGK